MGGGRERRRRDKEIPAAAAVAEKMSYLNVTFFKNQSCPDFCDW